MFKNMKPLPKALILAAIIGLPVAAYVKFMPQKPPAPAVEAVAPTTVPAEAAAPVVQAPAAPSAPSAPQTVQPALPTDAPTGLTPATNNAGLDAVLRATK